MPALTVPMWGKYGRLEPVAGKDRQSTGTYYKSSGSFLHLSDLNWSWPWDFESISSGPKSVYSNPRFKKALRGRTVNIEEVEEVRLLQKPT
jgi:hypothetical protein